MINTESMKTYYLSFSEQYVNIVIILRTLCVGCQNIVTAWHALSRHQIEWQNSNVSLRFAIQFAMLSFTSIQIYIPSTKSGQNDLWFMTDYNFCITFSFFFWQSSFFVIIEVLHMLLNQKAQSKSNSTDARFEMCLRQGYFQTTEIKPI